MGLTRLTQVSCSLEGPQEESQRMERDKREKIDFQEDVRNSCEESKHSLDKAIVIVATTCRAPGRAVCPVFIPSTKDSLHEEWVLVDVR